MGFKTSWQTPESMISSIQRMKIEACNRSNDGFTTWAIKQDMYRVKWALDAALRDCDNYGDEEQRFLEEHEQEELMNILRKKNHG